MRSRILLALAMIIGCAVALPPANAAGTPVTKVLVFAEENHSLNEALAGMPYTASLAKTYGYATHYTAIRHPSLPNYLAIAGGSTFGVTDDGKPPQFPIASASVFGQAVAAGKTAKTYAETMPSNCYRDNSGGYGVRHNPWAYFTPTAEKAACAKFDVPLTTSTFNADVNAGTLPTVGFVVPNTCDDAHSCSLGTADAWIKPRLQAVMAGPDWKAGRLAVVVVFDEDDGSQGNTVLAAVLHPSQVHHVVTTALNHYSLTRFMEDVAHVSHLHNAATAPNLATAFGLTIG